MSKCIICGEDAVYVSNNSEFGLCEECHMSMEDDLCFDMLDEDSLGLCFDEYYDFDEED